MHAGSTIRIVNTLLNAIWAWLVSLYILYTLCTKNGVAQGSRASRAPEEVAQAMQFAKPSEVHAQGLHLLQVEAPVWGCQYRANDMRQQTRAGSGVRV